MPELHIVALIYPAPGKSKRVVELLHEACQKVHEKEPDVYRYLMMTDVAEGIDDPTVVMMETYKDEAANDYHVTTDHFKELFAKAGADELMGKPPLIIKTEAIGGFDLDRNLIKP